ncbi:MAG: hypothetical protein QOD77_1963 [Thermoplasmata archaeon]|jgi:hypothetical protein|nr:hypothetical protein [Thermoplasmata archaeon]
MLPRLLPFLSLALLLSPALAVPAEAQSEFLYKFSMDLPSERAVLRALGQAHEVNITFHDRSTDNTNIVPGQPSAITTNRHITTFEITSGQEDDAGWIIAAQPGSLTTRGGDTKTTTFQVSVLPDAENPYFTAVVTARIQTSAGVFNATGTVQFFTTGIPGFNVPYGNNIQSLGPRESAQASLRVTNFGSLPRTFAFALGQNECGLKVAPPVGLTIPGSTTVDVPFTVLGPDTRFDPLGMDTRLCRIGIDTYAVDNPGQVRSMTVSAKLAPGIAIDPVLVFWLVAIAAAILLLVLLLRRRKEKIEEEILGKPQKPWTIPVEQVYLRELKARDPRAWYVVRHFLMEDEYRSALLWYRAYKKGTKGARRKEALILRQEHAYDKWKAKWAKRIAKPLTEADRFEAKLQRKLDRRARKGHRKALRAHKKQVAKLQAKQAKAVAAAKEAHAKAVAKAQRKDRPIPAAPDLPVLALPPKPEPRPVRLAEHRWAKKAARFRRRRVREQGNLEVKFERRDARYLAKLARKVRRIARKLDDPDFVAQHPLLRDGPAQARKHA